MNQNEFEAVYSEAVQPPQHIIHKNNHAEGTQTPAIMLPVMDVEGDTLMVEYEIVGEDIDDHKAEQLILGPLLAVFYDHDYKDDANSIHLKNVKNGYEKTLPYG